MAAAPGAEPGRAGRGHGSRRPVDASFGRGDGLVGVRPPHRRSLRRGHGRARHAGADGMGAVGAALAPAPHRVDGLRRVEHGPGGLADGPDWLLGAHPVPRSLAAPHPARPHRPSRGGGMAGAERPPSRVRLALCLSPRVHRRRRLAALPRPRGQQCQVGFSHRADAPAPRPRHPGGGLVALARAASVPAGQRRARTAVGTRLDRVRALAALLPRILTADGHQALRFFPDEAVGYRYPELYVKLFGADYVPEPHIRDAYRYARDHKWYMTSHLITVNDLYAFDPTVQLALEEFTDVVGRNFRQPKEGLGFDQSPPPTCGARSAGRRSISRRGEGASDPRSAWPCRLDRWHA